MICLSLMVRRRASAVSNHEARLSASPFETLGSRKLLRVRAWLDADLA
jgi:hypothetical protein